MKKKNILIIFTLIIGLIIAMIYINQQEQEPTFNIGILIASEERYEKEKGLKEGLRSLGFVEGKNTFYYSFYSNSERQQLRNNVKKMLAKKPDIIVTSGGGETLAVKEYGTSIPIVFIGVASPEEWGLVGEKNDKYITGVDNGQIDLIGKRLELMKELDKKLKKVLVIADEKAPITILAVGRAMEMAKKLGVTVELATVESHEEVHQLLLSNDIDFQGILPLPSFVLEDGLIKELPLLKEKKIIVMGSFPEQVQKGMFLAYGSSFYEQGLQASKMVSKILWGTKVEDVPREYADGIILKANYDSLNAINRRLNNKETTIFDEILYSGEEIK